MPYFMEMDEQQLLSYPQFDQILRYLIKISMPYFMEMDDATIVVISSIETTRKLTIQLIECDLIYFLLTYKVFFIMKFVT